MTEPRARGTVRLHMHMQSMSPPACHMKTFQLRTVRKHLTKDLYSVAVIQASPQVPFSLGCGRVRFWGGRVGFWGGRVRSHPECTKNGLNVLLVVDSDKKCHFFGGGSAGPTPKKVALFVRINCNRTEMTPIVLCTHHLYDHIILNLTFLTHPRVRTKITLIVLICPNHL